jgi:hypothetical protein
LDANVRELTIIVLVSCFSLGLAWAYEADFFAMFFAAAAAIAGVEAVRRSLTGLHHSRGPRVMDLLTTPGRLLARQDKATIVRAPD